MNYNKYGIMSETDFNFIKSNYPPERFKKLPVIPIVLSCGNGQQQIINGLVDSSSTNSFISVFYAKSIEGKIIDSIRTSGVTSIVEDKPVIKIKISNKSTEGQWIELNAAVIDTHHPNYDIILGRDFMENFKQITFDFQNQKTVLNY